MIRLGITGGIGSGKSYVSRLLRADGISVYDTDAEAKRLMLSHPSIRKDLIGLLGEDVYLDGRLNKPLLASYLFASSGNAARINGIVHPRVKEDFLSWASRQESGPVALESAILFESGFEDVVDKVIMVYAPLDVRIRRVMERDHATREQVESRIAAQMSDEEKVRRADFVIMNDGKRELQSQLSVLYDALALKRLR